jgi:hypothetical protein
MQRIKNNFRVASFHKPTSESPDITIQSKHRDCHGILYSPCKQCIKVTQDREVLATLVLHVSAVVNGSVPPGALRQPVIITDFTQLQ